MACLDLDMNLRIVDLDGEEIAADEDEADILGMIERDTKSDLGRIGQCSHLRVQILAFEVVAVVVGGNVMLLCHR